MPFKIIGLLVILTSSLFCKAQNTDYENGKIWIDKGNFVEALKYFEKAKDADPNSTEITEAYANAAYQCKKYVHALPVYEEILKKQPNHIDALIKLAVMYSYSSQKHKSVEYADRAMKLKPHSEEQRLSLADAFYFVKHYPKAIELYKSIVPANEYTLTKIAKSYVSMGNFNSASQYFGELVKILTVPNASVYYEYGNALFDNGQYQLATRAYLQAKELNFYNAKLINESIALGFMALKAYGPALEHYLAAKEFAPYDKALNLEIAKLYNQMGDFKKARDIIETMQETNPDDGDLVYAYGMTYYKEGKVAKAESYFNKAFEMKPALKSLRYTKSNF